MFVSHVQNFYTEDRWITYQGPDGKEISKQINGKNLRIPAKLTVVTGSTMPTSRIQQREEAIELYTMQIIDRPEVLDKLDVSNRNDILKRMEMGPIGQAMQKLQAIGVPPQLLQVFSQVIQAEPEKIEKALKAGQLPQFGQIMQQMQAQAQGQPPQQPQVDPAAQAEAQLKQAQAQKTMAEIQKIDAERALTIEKVTTEKVDQMVKQAGVQFDQEQMKINRARTVADVEKQSQSASIERVAMGKEIEAQRHGQEMDRVGMGKDIAAQRHGQDMDKANFVSAQNNSPGWNEKGLKSNNKE
jgi:glutamyl/glutaminyl-tRNA synthetase